MTIENSLLPQVTEDIGIKIQKLMVENTNYETELYQRIEKENPCIAEFIDNYSSTQHNPKEISLVALLVYDLLDKSGIIPKVESDIAHSLIGEMIKTKGYGLSMVEHIQIENPCVINGSREFLSTL